jgi:hypothetical protein
MSGMNLSLYSINAFIILDTEGSRVLAKYYRSKSHPLGESKEFLTLKEQKAFEKGLWQKTKKPGGECAVLYNAYAKLTALQAISSCTTATWRCISTRWTSSCTLSRARPRTS